MANFSVLFMFEVLHVPESKVGNGNRNKKVNTYIVLIWLQSFHFHNLMSAKDQSNLGIRWEKQSFYKIRNELPVSPNLG